MMQQPDLFVQEQQHTRESLRAFLNSTNSSHIQLAITHNRISMVSVVFESSALIKLRLHEAFLTAPPEVLRSLRSFLSTRQKAYWRVVSNYASSISAPASRARARRYHTRGQVYNLTHIRNEVNNRFFQSRLKCKISWGRRGQGKRHAWTRSIRFGTYRKDEDLVLINPRLDSHDVPLEFIEYIVFHELLHAAIPSVRRNGRWNHHPPEYRKFERQYPDWERMQRISKALLH